MKRRQFLQNIGATVPAAMLAPSSLWARDAADREVDVDVAIIGGGLGGCAAALAALKLGRRVALTEETDWIGGQLTSQAVPPDEHRWIETHGATASYRALRTGIRNFYRRHYPLSDQAEAAQHLNPGGGSVSRLCHEPRVALAVLHTQLLPYIESGRLILLLQHVPVSADVEKDRVCSATVQDRNSGEQRVIVAPYFLDATETGDLLPLTGTEYVTGFESQQETGEPHAPSKAQPQNMQAFTWCFPLEYVDGGDFVIDKPDDYEKWKSYSPDLKPPWPGRLFSWTYSHPITLKPRTLAFDPKKEASGWWLYRRIINKANFEPGFFAGSTTLVNWPQNDYLKGNLFDVPEEEAEKHRRAAKQLSLSLCYWMQTEAPRPDGGTGWPGLRLCPHITGTPDGLAKAPYIRESRRIKAMFTVLEQHVSQELNRPPDDGKFHTARFDDTVGVGSYRLDLHPSSGGDNYIDLASLPFEIPLGALIPQRMENLLAANKNIGTTHITNGCYRLHPVEWNIGESAGTLAAWCLEKKVTPRAVRSQAKRLWEFQKMLVGQGVELHWPG
jgi:hypothetical protein